MGNRPAAAAAAPGGFDAIEAGDYEAAAAAYRQALNEMPADAEAKAGLAQVELMARLQPLSAQEPMPCARSPPMSRTTLRPSSALRTWTSPAATSRTPWPVVTSSGGTSVPERETARVRLLELFDVVGTTTTAWPKPARHWPGCCSSVGALRAAEAEVPAAAAPRLGIPDVPVQLRARDGRGGAHRLAPHAPGLLCHRGSGPDPHRGQLRERRGPDQPPRRRPLQ